MDGDSSMLQFVARLFCDHEVYCAAGYREAVAIMTEDLGPTLDLIISDYQLPGMAGTEVFSAALAFHPAAVRVLLTGTPPADLSSLLAAGVVHQCLLKGDPSTFQRLLALV